MSTLLLIGGTGFFGKSFLDSFQRGMLTKWGVDRIIALSRNAERLQYEIPYLISEHIELINMDAGKTEWLPFADYVIHAATSSDAKKYAFDAESERFNIELGIDNYTQLAPTYHINSNVLYVSSGAVYGSQPQNISLLDENYVVKNYSDIPPAKRTYTKAKRYAEEKILGLGDIGIDVTIARCFSFAGIWLPREQHFAIGNFIQNALDRKPIIVKALSPVYRSYMHADDMVDWLMALVSRKNKSSKIFNVGSDEAVEISELARKIGKLFSVEVISEKYMSQEEDRYIPNIKLAQNELGLNLSYNLDCLLKDLATKLTGKHFEKID